MAKKRDNNKSFYGMQVVGRYEPIVGVCCELTDMGKITLRFYHTEHGKYVYDQLKTFPRKKICTGETVMEALYNLRKIVDKVKPSYKIYLNANCYKAIIKYCENKKVLKNSD